MNPKRRQDRREPEEQEDFQPDAEADYASALRKSTGMAAPCEEYVHPSGHEF